MELESEEKENIHPDIKTYAPVALKKQRRYKVLKSIAEKCTNNGMYPKRQMPQEHEDEEAQDSGHAEPKYLNFVDETAYWYGL